MLRGSVTNPFSSHCVGPSNLGYIFPAGESLQSVLQQFEHANWTGEITGPHGIGKSTLLHTIADAQQNAGRRIVMWRCSDQRRTLPLGWRFALHAVDICFLDGAERLMSWQLSQLIASCSRRRCGLIITTHVTRGFGYVFRPATSEFQLREIVHTLAPELLPRVEMQLSEMVAQCRGNIRNVLFELYDLYESVRCCSRERVAVEGANRG